MSLTHDDHRIIPPNEHRGNPILRTLTVQYGFLDHQSSTEAANECSIMPENQSDSRIGDEQESRGKRPSRKISRLTSQQAQRKRDLDRSSQQAYRQRVKSRIENLEEELDRMKADSGSSQETLLRKIQTLHDENHDLKTRLASIYQLANIANPIATPNRQRPISRSSAPVATASIQPEIHNDHPAGNQVPSEGLIAERDGPASPEHYVQSPHSIPSVAAQNVIGSTIDTTYSQNDDAIIPSPRSDALSTSLRQRVPQPCLSHSENTPGDDHHTKLRESLAEVGLPQMTVNQGAFDPSTSPESIKSIESTMPRHIPGIYPIEKIILDFINSRRALAARGLPTEAVLGPDQPQVQGFVQPENVRGVHPLCQILTEILLTFRDVALPEKLAFMFVMFRNTRWQLSGSRTDYHLMPEWLRPTAIQITIPHSAWIDNLPWPQMRDKMIENTQEYPYSTFSSLYSPNVTVSWPHDPMDAVVETPHGTVLNPIFEKHIRKLENWQVYGPFVDHLPGLAATAHR